MPEGRTKKSAHICVYFQTVPMPQLIAQMFRNLQTYIHEYLFIHTCMPAFMFTCFIMCTSETNQTQHKKWAVVTPLSQVLNLVIGVHPLSGAQKGKRCMSGVQEGGSASKTTPMS